MKGKMRYVHVRPYVDVTPPWSRAFFFFPTPFLSFPLPSFQPSFRMFFSVLFLNFLLFFSPLLLSLSLFFLSSILSIFSYLSLSLSSNHHIALYHPLSYDINLRFPRYLSPHLPLIFMHYFLNVLLTILIPKRVQGLP